MRDLRKISIVQEKHMLKDEQGILEASREIC